MFLERSEAAYVRFTEARAAAANSISCREWPETAVTLLSRALNRNLPDETKSVGKPSFRSCQP